MIKKGYYVTLAPVNLKITIIDGLYYLDNDIDHNTVFSSIHIKRKGINRIILGFKLLNELISNSRELTEDEVMIVEILV